MIEQARQWARVLKRDAHAIYLAARDPRVPWYAKALALCVAGYALSPIDLIPDFVPGPRLPGRCHHCAVGHFGRRQIDSARDHGGTSLARSGRAESAREPHRRNRDRNRLGSLHRACGMALLSIIRRLNVPLVRGEEQGVGSNWKQRAPAISRALCLVYRWLSRRH